MLEALGFNDGICVAGFAAPEGVEHLSGGVVADRAVLNALDDLRQLLRCDLGRFDADFFGIQAFGDFAHDPVAGKFGLPAFLRGLVLALAVAALPVALRWLGWMAPFSAGSGT